MNINRTAIAMTENTALPSIESALLGNVTGGCAACGQSCSNGPAPATSVGSKPSAQFAAFSDFSRR